MESKNYLVTTDENGIVLELYTDAPGFAAPPSDAISISHADGELLRFGFAGYKLSGGKIVPPSISIADLKTAKNAEINKWREEANFSSFTWRGKPIASDKLSRSDIDAVCGSIGLNGVIPASFPGAWKAVDNTIIPIPDVATFKEMYQSMVDTGAANFIHSQQLKAQLTKVATPADVEAIVW
jgi:hypothetical protein